MNQTQDRSTLSAGAIAIIILVTAIWGFNFIVIKIGVQGVPPLLLAALRFVFSSFPALLFVRKPAVPWRKLAAYGLLLGVGEFGLLFTAIKLGAPAGVSSIILQAQAFLTAVLAAFLLKEKIRTWSLAGMLIAGAGLVLIGLAGNGGSLASIAPLPFAMLLLAALFWALANLVAQRMPKTDGLSLMVWSSIFSPLPLFALSLLFERNAILPALASLAPISIASLAYLVLLSTLFGYGAWNQLIMKHGAKAVAPFSLLVPFFGVTSGVIFLHEQLSLLQIAAAALVILGLAIHALGGRFFKKNKKG